MHYTALKMQQPKRGKMDELITVGLLLRSSTRLALSGYWLASTVTENSIHFLHKRTTYEQQTIARHITGHRKTKKTASCVLYLKGFSRLVMSLFRARGNSTWSAPDLDWYWLLTAIHGQKDLLIDFIVAYMTKDHPRWDQRHRNNMLAAGQGQWKVARRVGIPGIYFVQ